ncbi:MAG: hypothetical protein IPJ65_42490 [Archangiaceae bacterium]|nr:hypothetical protein [Archangiaceae bacterium]
MPAIAARFSLWVERGRSAGFCAARDTAVARKMVLKNVAGFRVDDRRSL